MPDEAALTQLADRLEAQGVPIHRIVESEGKHKNQLMALGVRPGLKSERGKYLSSLPLLNLRGLKEHRDAVATWQEQLRVYHVELERTRKLAQERALTWTQRIARWWHRSATTT